MRQLGAAFAIVAFASLAHADDLKAHIQKTQPKIAAAMKTKSVKTFDKVLRPMVTKDFTYKEAGETQTYDQMLKGMEMGFAALQKITKVSTKIVSVSSKGDQGKARMSHVMEGWSMGKDKKKHVMTFTGSSEDTYQKVGGVWKMKSMSFLASKMLMDGKSMTVQPTTPVSK